MDFNGGQIEVIQKLSLNVKDDLKSEFSTMYCDDELSPTTSLSTDTSITSQFDSDISCYGSTETEPASESESFLQHYVKLLFDPMSDISVCDKQRFGELSLSKEGRELFAKYINNQRCVSKQVDETMFYKLAHNFALVLFECAEADDFGPSKTLMNMAFTFYHIPESVTLQFQVEDEVVELKSPDSEFVENYSHELTDEDESKMNCNIAKEKKKFSLGSYRKKKSSSSEDKTTVIKMASAWFSKEFVPLFQPNKRKSNISETKLNKSEPDLLSSNLKNDEESGKLPKNHFFMPNDQVNRKVFLYEVLRRQSIWKSIRFWNAAFFDSLNQERKRHFGHTGWNSLTEEERQAVNLAIQNATFGQLGTFINNMKYLGLGQKTCMEFLRKQSIIGNLGKDLYQILKTQVETPLKLDCA
uniref:Uncharacterized protein KIAA0513-like n=1 Tax=Phallusia mammillata TaxID=59560 RepID=A0A6F9DGC7_9ASCI|nr:uncharacterized protein KIAA0513-like [Phallusia mammillata]